MKSCCVRLALGIIAASAFLTASLWAAATAPCRIQVVEKGSGWPVSLVELRTTHNCGFVSDNDGVIAFDLPELMGHEVYFEVASPGYEVRADGFGYRGVRLTPRPGHRLKVEVQRTAIARRMGRLTGAGLFAEAQMLGEHGEWQESGVVGCDSTQNAFYKGRLFWLWGDTTLSKYPLGIFNASCATTEYNPLKSGSPPLRIPYDYFRDAKGAPRGVANIPGDGPTWLSGLVNLKDSSGEEKLVANYVKIKPPLEAYESGLTIWDDAKESFLPFKVIWKKDGSQSKAPPVPEGHTVYWAEAGTNWVLFGNPLPALRCEANFESWSNPKRWQILKPQSTIRSAADGAPIKPHTGSIAWNPWRKRWVTVFMQANGKPSAFGELWYAEADSPLGPWGPAVKVLSHQSYTFYNPKLHPQFSASNSPALYFEGTYTIQFSDAKRATPRHDYNQLLYRLDLDDPRLKPASER